ncbi:MAG: GMC family oxidoreductase [Parvularculaceae bacterium]
MFIDLSATRENPFTDTYDVCVCGSGPAGMSVALEVANKGGRVLLLEAGGYEPSAESQAVCEAKSVGPLVHWGVSTCRLRYLGGASGHWSGRCAILDPLDFEARDIWGFPGWPISHKETYRRLDDARIILDIADQTLDRREISHWRQDRFLPNGFARSAPTRFGEKFRDELKASKNIDVALNANVTGLSFSDDKVSITAVKVKTYDGRDFAPRAKAYVIAFGALETARFMLNVGEEAGFPFGNEGDYVGRCFMEHFNIVFGRFVTLKSPLWVKTPFLNLNLNNELTKEHGLGTATVTLTANDRPRHYGRLAFLREAKSNLECAILKANPKGDASRDKLCNGDGVVAGIIEQTPDPSSRVTLDDEARDQFGAKRLLLDWRMNEQDTRTITGLAEQLGVALAAQDIGRLQIAPDIRRGSPEPGFHCHQMGTTRMSASPRHGVVNEDCRIHGMQNAYIAGSNVFSTGGGANPTTTIVALALRLGEHLAGRYVGK